MKKTLVINLFGGPGVGKSTLCASVFAKLKIMGIDCEMATEYAKGAMTKSKAGTGDILYSPYDVSNDDNL